MEVFLLPTMKEDLIGIITNRDLRFQVEMQTAYWGGIMTKDRLITTAEGTDLKKLKPCFKSIQD